MENYTLTGSNGSTMLAIDMDIVDEFKDYFAKTWPQALEKVKALQKATDKTVITISTT